MQAKDIMTSRVIKVRHDAAISEAISLMRQHHIGFLPLVRDGWISGVVTDRDILVRGMTHATLDTFARVSAVATQPVQFVDPETPLAELAATMVRHKLRRLPVCDALGYIVGVISLTDLARHGARDALTQVYAAMTENTAPATA
ncbi:CBS domain-containing protein [Pacificoceanicola onchidii]|uniref:CBS domain-containing protein n=1 Tax=Pacificoceanicola onchidii TaxID=2562685 RepID=UPI001455F04E|nr:CBS domain-containing protein [Pacificoceanicola onchidii]